MEENYKIATNLTRCICDVIDTAIYAAMHQADGGAQTLSLSCRAHLRNAIESHIVMRGEIEVKNELPTKPTS